MSCLILAPIVCFDNMRLSVSNQYIIPDREIDLLLTSLNLQMIWWAAILSNGGNSADKGESWNFANSNPAPANVPSSQPISAFVTFFCPYFCKDYFTPPKVKGLDYFALSCILFHFHMPRIVEIFVFCSTVLGYVLYFSIALLCISTSSGLEWGVFLPDTALSCAWRNT